MSEDLEHAPRWPQVVKAGSIFVERLRPLFQTGPPSLETLFSAMATFYIEVPVEAFSRDEQHLLVEWGGSDGWGGTGTSDYFSLRRGFYDNPICCDVSIDAYFTREASVAAPEAGSPTCWRPDAIPNY